MRPYTSYWRVFGIYRSQRRESACGRVAVMRRFQFVKEPLATDIGDNVEAFLRSLEGPTCFFLEGEDDSRTRALVTLLHGNEPSGAMAVFRWLKSCQRPAVNIVVIVASVAAALEFPVFSHRMLPRARDLNRCFRPPFDDAQGALAEEILEILHMHHPEAVIDMHNTSGSGPSFGVCTHMDHQHDALVSLFTQRLIVSNLGLGALDGNQRALLSHRYRGGRWAARRRGP